MQATNPISNLQISNIIKDETRICWEKAKINDLMGDNFPVLEKKSEHANQKDSLI